MSKIYLLLMPCLHNLDVKKSIESHLCPTRSPEHMHQNVEIAHNGNIRDISRRLYKVIIIFIYKLYNNTDDYLSDYSFQDIII